MTETKELKNQILNLKKINELQDEIITKNHKISSLESTIKSQESRISYLEDKLFRTQAENRVLTKFCDRVDDILGKVEESKAL